MTAAQHIGGYSGLMGRDQVEISYRRLLGRHPALTKIFKAEYKAAQDSHNFRAALARCKVVEASIKLGSTGLYADSGEERITDYCKAKTAKLERDFTAMVKRFSLPVAMDWIKGELVAAGLALPLKDKDTADKERQLSAVSRAVCPLWWRRQLRRVAARMLEHFLRCRGLVCRKRGAYASTIGLNRRKDQKTRNRQLLMSLEAVCDDEEGTTVNLAEAAAANVSNPELRRTELMTRISGYEQIADRLGMTGLFLTLTCPSKYHPVHHTGALNKKYNGTTPREAQEYLSRVWANIRARWHKAGIRAFGFRVAEPHHDGTPHWHLMLFFSADQWEEAAAIFRVEALKEDGSESGAQKYRMELVVMDKAKGTAAGYIAKYIAKNIDGFNVGDDFEAQAPADEAAARVDAWAGIWGIRQFQQIGSTSVTVWRELRRVREELADTSPELLKKIHAAADAGDWAEFVELMGGALVTRNGQALRAWMVEKPGESKYFEITERMRGVVMRGVALLAGRLITRPHQWTVRPVSERSECLPGAP